MIWFNFAVVLIAGAILPLQAGVNAQLSRAGGNVFWASAISFLVGTLVLFTIFLSIRHPWPGITQLKTAPIWVWSGGFMGAFFVTTMAILAPKLGATTLITLVIAGQLSMSLTLDHFGLIGYSTQHINIWRVFGVFLIATGVFLIRKF